MQGNQRQESAAGIRSLTLGGSFTSLPPMLPTDMMALLLLRGPAL
jgi:hypothetical protein